MPDRRSAAAPAMARNNPAMRKYPPAQPPPGPSTAPAPAGRDTPPPATSPTTVAAVPPGRAAASAESTTATTATRGRALRPRGRDLNAAQALVVAAPAAPTGAVRR